MHGRQRLEVSSELRFRRVSIMTRQVSYADVILRYKASSIPSTNCVKGVRRCNEKQICYKKWTHGND